MESLGVGLDAQDGVHARENPADGLSLRNGSDCFRSRKTLRFAETPICILLRSVTEVHVDLYAERLRDGWANRYGAVSGTSARKTNAKIRSSSRYCERELIYTLHGHLARS